MRKITAFTRRCRSVASLAFQIAPFASFSFSYVKTITTRRYTFERHVWTCALHSGIFCVSAGVSSNSTLKRENIIHHLHRHRHYHYHGRRCHHHPASTENRRYKPCIRPAGLRFEFRRREKNCSVLTSKTCRKSIAVGQRFSLETALILLEKEFIIPKAISNGKK